MLGGMRTAVSAGTILVLSALPVSAQQCGGGFERWLANFKQEAASQGVSQRTLAAAAPLMVFDQQVVSRDRGQRVFTQTFLEFSKRMAEGYRIGQGQQRIKQNAALFQQIEQRFGVPGPVLVAFWGLETDFGKVMGDMPTLRSVTTLAYDCRRPELFRKQTLAALKIIERGDLTPDSMTGPFAGELGQLQFLPEHYLEYGVDFDNDGRVDLIRSSADALASAANYMSKLGWKRGQPWLQEVRVPANMPWEQADVEIEHPLSQWVSWGVRAAHGSLPSGGLQASLILPMGRNGPAFLAYPNFKVYTEWNHSLIYATTAAYLATRIGGAPRLDPGRGEIDGLSFEETRQLQQLLQRRGYDVGKIDGIIGAQTRAAVRDMQKKAGLPADSYPTTELLSRLRGG
ncbi:MAG TPA: lytic murein transglycosylase [Xanthobacteraceae bacterium]|nr:lytic murein transglycosylase [Xanthobacteraceae bacterium]